MNLKEILEELKKKAYNKIANDDAIKARDELRKLGRDPKLDLLQHYYGSKNLANMLPFGYLGDAGAFGVGLGKEMLNYFNQPSGFSVDDMGANWAGITNMTLNEADERNLFNHTESKENIKGFGQGDVKQVSKKLGLNIFDDELRKLIGY
jgi:hypothetical protein